MDSLVDGLEHSGIPGAVKGFRKGIGIMRKIPYDRSRRKPRVLIVGEYLLNFHPGANHDIEKYLENNGFEVIEAKMTDVIRKTYFYQDKQIQEYHLNRGITKRTWLYTADHIFNLAHDTTDRIAKEHPLYEPAVRMQDLVKESDPIIHHTFDAGEGGPDPGRDPPSRKRRMQGLCYSSALRMPSQSCGRTGHRKEAEGKISGRADPSP